MISFITSVTAFLLATSSPTPSQTSYRPTDRPVACCTNVYPFSSINRGKARQQSLSAGTIAICGALATKRRHPSSKARNQERFSSFFLHPVAADVRRVYLELPKQNAECQPNRTKTNSSLTRSSSTDLLLLLATTTRVSSTKDAPRKQRGWLGKPISYLARECLGGQREPVGVDRTQ